MVSHTKNENKGKFELTSDQNEEIAKLTYIKPDANTLVIDHTEVSKNFRGQDYGKKIVVEAINFAEENDLDVEATCSYANAILRKLKK